MAYCATILPFAYRIMTKGKTMKTGELADRIGVKSQTIRNWANHDLLKRYWSDGATGRDNASQRHYNDEDIRVAITIHTLRNRDNVEDWQAIADYLASGKRYDQWPGNSRGFDQGVVSVTAAEQSAKAAANLAALQELQSQLAVLQNEIQRLRDENQQLRGEHRKEVNDLHDRYQDRIARLYAQIADLNRELGRKEGDD